jgi:DNA polymerase-3 subunit alpha
LQYGEWVKADAVLAVRGSIDRRGGDEANLIVNELIPVEQLDARYTRGVQIRVHELKHGEQGLERLREILRGYPGPCEVQILLHLSDGSRVHLRAGNLRVEVSAELRARVDDLLGAGNLRVLGPQLTSATQRRRGPGEAAQSRRASARSGAASAP